MGIDTFIAFYYALEHQQSWLFTQNVFKARFMQGMDIGNDATLIDCAIKSHLNPRQLIEAVDDSRYLRMVKRGVINGLKDGLIGVPYFVFGDKRYWGNDRLEWLLRDWQACQEMDVPDLTERPLGPIVSDGAHLFK